MDLETRNAHLAATVVREAGGALTFEEYDHLMDGQRYFAPFHWIVGWALPPSLRKANYDKLCAFAACRLGLLEQTATGYALSSSPL